MAQTPSVGRIVHYTNLGDADGKYPPETQAAIITSVKLRDEPNKHVDAPCSEDCYEVNIAVFYRTGLFFMPDPVKFSAEPGSRGTWMWPPRV